MSAISCAIAVASSFVVGLGASAETAPAPRYSAVPRAPLATAAPAPAAAPAPSCPQAHTLADIDSEDFTDVSARGADAVFDCLALTADERLALTIYRANAKPLSARTSFDAWFLSADVAVSDTLLFDNAEGFFAQQPQQVKDAWPSLKGKLAELFSDRRLAFEYVDEAKKVLDLHWRTFETELSAADDFLGLENDSFIPNRQPIVATGYSTTLDQVLTAVSKLPDPIGTAGKALSGFWGLLNVALNRAPPVDVSDTGRVVSGQTGRSRLGITVANLRLNYERDYLARAAALANLKTFIVRDLGLINELAEQRAADITSNLQASEFAAESTLRVRKEIIETLLPIRGVLYGSDITKHMAAVFVSDPQSDFGPDKDLQTGLTLRLAPHFPVGRTWAGGVMRQSRDTFCPTQTTTRTLGNKRIIDEPCPDHLAYSGYRYWEGEHPEGEFQVWRLAFAGGENEIPRLATDGMSAVPGFNSPFEWITSVMNADEIFTILVNAQGRFLIQQPPLDCQPGGTFGWTCESERISAPVRDERSYVRLPLPDGFSSSYGMAEARGSNIVEMNVTGQFRSMNSVSYWPPTAQGGRFNYRMRRYFPEGTDGTLQRCYGEGGQGTACRDFQKAVMVPSNWIVLTDGAVKLPEPIPAAPPAFQSNMMIKATSLGQCLEVELNTPVKGAGRRVVTAPCTGVPEQLWTMDSRSASPITHPGVDGQRLCLDVDDSNPMASGARAVHAWPCKAGIIIGISNQAWTFGSNGTLEARSGFPITTRALTMAISSGAPGIETGRHSVMATPPSRDPALIQQWSFVPPPTPQ